jgi:hypothetical protein
MFLRSRAVRLRDLDRSICVDRFSVSICERRIREQKIQVVIHMSELKYKILKAAAFDGNLCWKGFCETMAYPPFASYHTGYNKRNAELKPLLEALAECVGALEFYADRKHWTTHDYEMLFNNISDHDWERSSGSFAGGKHARAAIRKLERMVEK